MLELSSYVETPPSSHPPIRNRTSCAKSVDPSLLAICSSILRITLSIYCPAPDGCKMCAIARRTAKRRGDGSMVRMPY